MTIKACPNYPTTKGDLPNFVGECKCNDPDLYYDVSTTHISQQMVTNRIYPDVKWMLEPWSSGPPYNMELTYGPMCRTTLDRLGCPAANMTIVSSGAAVVNGAGVKVSQFQCYCGKFTAATAMVNDLIIDSINAYELTTTPIFSNPVYLSVGLSIAVVFIAGKIGAIAAVYLKLPSIIGFLLAGFAVQNILSPMFLKGPGYPYPSVNSEMKLVALIIVLMRAGLAIKLGEIKANLVPTIVLCFIPYMGEFFTIMYSGKALLTGWSDAEMGLFASVMAPLGPSLVISSMLVFASDKKKEYGYTPAQIIMSSPFEAVVAIVLFNIFGSLVQTESPPLYPWVKLLPFWLNIVLIPVNLIFSAVMGYLVGWAVSKYIHYRVQFKTDYIWTRMNKNPQMGKFFIYIMFFL
jgi:hypothetical protein